MSSALVKRPARPSGGKEEEEFTLKEKLLYAGGSIVIVVGGFILGRKLVRKLISGREEKKTFEEKSPATYAKMIKMAFENDGWLGTNTTELRKVMREIPSKQVFTQVGASYQKLYNSNLYRDLSDELQSSEYNEMLAIINAKPDRIGKKGEQQVVLNHDAWAKRLKAAFDKTYGPFPGTDEDAIKAVFNEIPTQADFQKVADAYYKLYSRTLIDDLKGELEFWEYSDFMKIITSKPQS